MSTKPLPAKPKNVPFTKEAFTKIQHDLARLQKARKEILARLQTAREMGDLSENAAYQAAKLELRTTDRQIQKLRYLLKVGKITSTKNTDGSIKFGSKIVLSNKDSQLSFTLVSNYESDPKQHKLSLQSPIGKAVLGKKAGDKVTVSTPSGKISFTIQAVD